MLDVQNRLPTPGKENRVKITQDSGAVVEGVLSYADDATQDGTFWNRKNGQLLQGDIRELTIKDGESISAGDVVNVDDGVYRGVTPQANVENVIQGQAIIATDTIKLNSAYSIVATVYQNNSKLILSTVSNSDGKNVQTTDTTIQNVSSVSLARLDDSHFAVLYLTGTTLYKSIRTVNGTSISGGGATSMVANVDSMTSITLSESYVLAIYNSDGLHCRLIHYTGSSSSSGTEYSLSGNTGANYISACNLPDDSNGNKRVCICFADTGDGNKGKAVIATIDSSNAVTFGNVTTIKETSSSAISVACDSQRILFTIRARCYVSNIDLSSVEDLSFSTATLINISEGVFASISPSNSPNASSSPSSSVILIFNDSGVQRGTSFSYTLGSKHLSVASISQNKILLSYANSKQSDYGYTTILEVLGNQSAGSFLDTSKDAIALASGSGGDIIPVGFGGYCQCDGVTEGQEIISGGVSAFSPLDGWLYLLGEGMKRLGTQMQIVSYVGTGTYGVNNPCSITADFQISIAIYLGYDRGSGIMDGFPDGGPVMIPSIISTEYKNGAGFRQGYGKKSSDSHTLYWYNYADAMTQLNYSKYKYYFLILG